MKRLIVFLVRKRLGLKKYERFTFANQKSTAEYYFGEECLMKVGIYGTHYQSNASLNWLLNDECEIVKSTLN